MVKTEPAILMELVAEEARSGDEPPVLLNDATGFLAAIDKLYELAVAVAPSLPNMPDQIRLKWNPNDLLGESADRLRVRRMSFGSPFDLSTIVQLTPITLGGIWLFLQILEKVLKLRMERDVLRHELEKGRLEILKLRSELKGAFPELSEEELRQRIEGTGQGKELFERVIKRLRSGAFRLRGVVIKIVDRL